MPTKTTSKGSARKPAKTAAHKPAAKAKVAPKKKAEPEKKAAPAAGAAKTARAPATKSPAAPATKPVSLIDKAKAGKESKDGQVKTKSTFLPPISKLLPKIEATATVP